MNASAVIAEDEPLLAQALQAELARAWPELRDRRQRGRRRGGRARRAAAPARTCCSSTSACRGKADWKPRRNWPTNGRRTRPSRRWCSSRPTTSTRVQAFEAQAVDYVLKPVQPARLQKTVDKGAGTRWRSAARSAAALEATLGQLRRLLQAAPAAPRSRC